MDIMIQSNIQHHAEGIAIIQMERDGLIFIGAFPFSHRRIFFAQSEKGKDACQYCESKKQYPVDSV